MRAVRRPFHLALTLALTSGLAACGGGGGGSSSSSSSSGGSSGGGEFTLSTTTANFKALSFDAPPAEARITLTVTGSRVAAVGAAYVNITPPAWLDVTIEGTSPNLTLVLHPNSTQFGGSHFTTTLTVGTADSAGAVLATREIAIAYDVIVGMTLPPAPIETSFVYGSSRTVDQVNFNVNAGVADKTWTVTSDQPWVSVPAGNQTGNADLSLTVNGAATGVAPGGTATAQLVFQNTVEPIDHHTVTINANIVAPAPIVTANNVTLGGANSFALGSATGLASLRPALDVALDTGTNTYPWTVTFETAQSEGWLTSDVPGGNAGGAQHSTVKLGVGAPIGALGNYTATAHFDSTVLGQTFRTSVPVTLKWHGQRLFAEQNGVAFSSFPNRVQPATRTLKISGGRGVNDVPWTAISNQGWLTVTPNGVTGGTMTLTANPTGMTGNTLHIAEVTLASTSANIERNETIRVALWVGSTNPANINVDLPTYPYALAVNPVEPYAYSLYNGAIHVYNVYTGAAIATFNGDYGNVSGGFGYPISLALSSDGHTLYVSNGASSKVIAVDAATGAVLNTWTLEPRFGTPLDSPLRYTRTNGYPLLWTPFGDIVTVVLDLDDGSVVHTGGNTSFQTVEGVRATSPDGSRIFSIDGFSSGDTISQYTTAFGVLGGRTLELNYASSAQALDNGFTRQICVSATNTRLYTINGGGMQEIAIDQDPTVHLREVPHPDLTSTQALDCNWNGRIYVGLETLSAPQNNVFALNAAGSNIGSFPSGPADASIVVRLMGLTGDSRRIVTTNSRVGNPDPIPSLSFANVPP